MEAIKPAIVDVLIEATTPIPSPTVIVVLRFLYEAKGVEKGGRERIKRNIKERISAYFNPTRGP